MTRLPATVLALGLLSPLALAQGIALNDTFDRPNSTDLGPDWIEAEPFADARIQNNRFLANNGIFGWALHTGFQAAYVDTVIRFDWDMNGVGYAVSAIAGAAATPTSWEGIEVRLCDCAGYDDKADSIAFHAAPNAGSWPAGPAPIGPGGWPIGHPTVGFNLATPISAGTLTLYFEDSGDTAVAVVSSAAGGTEVFRASGILNFQTVTGFRPGPPTGLGVGIGYEGRVTVDDFRAWTGSPDAGAVYTLTPPRTGRRATFLVTDAAPASAVAMLYSVTGAGPIPTPWGPLLLSPPVFQLIALPTDPNGRAAVSLPSVPASLSGLVLYNQAFDAVPQTLTNGFVSTFN